MRIFLIISYAAISLLLPEICYAQTNLSPRCGDVVEMMKYGMQGLSSNNFVYELQHNGQTYYVLYLSAPDKSKNDSEGKAFTPWRLLERQGASLTYCLIAAGSRTTLLRSMQDANPHDRYGMPGSGYPRCTNGKDPLDTMDMQLWANKELGESLVLVLYSAIGNNNFLFLMSDGEYWILINSDKQNINESCYYARGDTATGYQNKSITKAPTAASKLTPSNPDTDTHLSKSTNYQNEDYYLQQVLGPNGHLDKALHDQFWQQFNGESEHDVTLVINWIKGSILVTQEFEKELWKSALLSYNTREVVKTERLIQLEKQVPEMAKESLPLPRGSSQYAEALAGFNSVWTTSMEDAKRLLDAAANHKPFITVHDTEVQLNEQTIKQASSSIDAGFIRLNKLLDRNWTGF